MMKRLLAFVMLMAACGTGAWAQAVATDTVRAAVTPSADTVRTAAPAAGAATTSATATDDNDDDDDDGENVIGGRVMRTPAGTEANLIGSPVYYSATAGNQAVRPAHHYLNSLSNNFDAVFFECKLLAGRHDAAAGFQLAVVPGRWGGYGSVLFGREHNYLSGGAVLRLSDYNDSGDWQLYGGLIGGCGVGAEGGLRWAMPRAYNHRFSWASVSVGAAVMNGRGYFTCGLSLEVTGLVLLSWLYW